VWAISTYVGGKYPSDVILKAYDFARLVPDSGVPKTGREKTRDACEGKGS
jgi:hypothetical protein